MRKKYRIFWNMGPSQKREGDLFELVLDFPLSFLPGPNSNGKAKVLVSYSVLNEWLKKGGGDGGMSPGATWLPFEISENDYKNLVEKLQSLNYEQVKDKHPYFPEELIVDFELNSNFLDPDEWEKQYCLKYRGVSWFMQFLRERKYPLFFNKKLIGNIEFRGGAIGSHFRGKFLEADNIKILDYCKTTSLSNDNLSGFRFSNYPELNWFEFKREKRLEIIDRWGYTQKIIKMYLSDRLDVAIKPTFKRIEPRIK